MPRGRPLKNRSVYWSEDHRFLLAWCAAKAQRHLRSVGLFVDTEELMQEGWLGCLRRVPKERLRLARRNTTRTMLRFAFSHYKSLPLKEAPPEGDDHLCDIQARDLADSLLARVDRPLAEAARFYWLEGMTLKQTGRALGVTGEAVRCRLQSFREKAADLISERML